MISFFLSNYHLFCPASLKKNQIIYDFFYNIFDALSFKRFLLVDMESGQISYNCKCRPQLGENIKYKDRVHKFDFVSKIFGQDN